MRRLPGWFGRLRPRRYAALRTVWHEHYDYGASRLYGRPSDAYVAAAEYAWQMGEAALARQVGTIDSQQRNGWWHHRSKVDTTRVARALAKRRAAENMVDV